MFCWMENPYEVAVIKLPSGEIIKCPINTLKTTEVKEFPLGSRAYIGDKIYLYFEKRGEQENGD